MPGEIAEDGIRPGPQDGRTDAPPTRANKELPTGDTERPPTLYVNQILDNTRGDRRAATTDERPGGRGNAQRQGGEGEARATAAAFGRPLVSNGQAQSRQARRPPQLSPSPPRTATARCDLCRAAEEVHKESVDPLWLLHCCVHVCSAVPPARMNAGTSLKEEGGGAKRCTRTRSRGRFPPGKGCGFV